MFEKFRSIPSENKGFKMLSKLGWSEGQSLGKNNDGLLEPVSELFPQLFWNVENILLLLIIWNFSTKKFQIQLKMNDKTKGLGCDNNESTSSFQDQKQRHKSKIWQKTHQRYHASEATVDIFKDDESD